MNKNHKNRIGRHLILTASQIFIEYIFMFLVGVVDIWFLSQVSNVAAASIGAVLPILGLIMAIFASIAFAGNHIASQRIGANDTSALPYAYGAMLFLAVLIGVGISAAIVIFSDTLISILQLEGEMAELSTIYLEVIGYGCLILSLRFFAAATLLSKGKVHQVLFGTIIVTISNIFFNYIFVFGKFGAPKLGVQGVAIASIISWTISLLFYCVIIFWSLKTYIRINLSKQGIKEHIKPILSISIPSLLETFSWHLTQLVIISFIVEMGETALATRVYIFNLVYLAAMATQSIALATQLQISRLVGAKRYKEANSHLEVGVKYGILTTFLIFFVFISQYKTIFGLFTNQEEVLDLVVPLLIIDIFGKLGVVLNFVIGGSLRACSDAKYISINGTISLCLLAIPLAWLLGVEFSMGLIGIWIAVSIEENIRGVIALQRWKSKRWMNKGKCYRDRLIHSEAQ